jgi:hypothetical protein
MMKANEIEFAVCHHVLAGAPIERFIPPYEEDWGECFCAACVEAADKGTIDIDRTDVVSAEWVFKYAPVVCQWLSQLKKVN